VHCQGTAKALQMHCKGIAKAQNTHCKSTAKALQTHCTRIKHCKSIERALQRHCITKSLRKHHRDALQKQVESATRILQKRWGGSLKCHKSVTKAPQTLYNKAAKTVQYR
jgi:hypothetical protein